MTTKRTDELAAGDVVQVAGRWRIVRSRTPAGSDWDLELDPPVVEAPPGPLRRPGGEKWFIREDGDGYGDWAVEFNPITGDLTVTSRTGVMVVEGVRPGVARLSTKRRDPNVGVKV